MLRPSDNQGLGQEAMRPEDFQPDDQFAQIQGLVDELAAERAACEAAEAENKAKSDLMAMIGHELRTPMEAVVAMSELLLASLLDATQARYTETLYRSARSLLGVLSDLLDFARLESGRFELEQASFDLHDLIQGVGAVLQTRAAENGLTGGVDIGADCPRFIVGDAARLRQVLLSLVDRQRGQIHRPRFGAPARERAGTRRSPAPEIRRNRHRRRLEQGRAGAAVPTLCPDREQDRRPDRRHRPWAVDRAETRQLMGGEIGCESVVGQGTLYWFTLPAESACVPAPIPQPDKEPPQQGTLEGHVLVVEESPPISTSSA
jgi:hypothetical protein